MYKVTLLVLLVILFYLLYKHQNEHFYRSEIYKDDDFLESDSEEDHFKYMDRNISEFRIKSDDYGYLKQVPELKFLSYDTCPNLYYLFHGIKSKNSEEKYIRGENTQGIQFRNDCEKIFYNTTLFVRTEHPIIDIEAVDTYMEVAATAANNATNNTATAAANNADNAANNATAANNADNAANNADNAANNATTTVNSKNYQNFTFDCLENTERTLSYLNKYNEEQKRFCNFEKELKQIFFKVKSNFDMDDILRYVDFCFTQLCFGMIYIEKMLLTSNHYRVFPCPCRKGAFFILPERIRHQVSMEGKEYTRAKCNTCCLNLIVLFGTTRPEKFDFIYEFAPVESCYAPSDIFKQDLDSIEF